MTNKEYVEGVLCTKSSHFDPKSVDTDLLHATLGLVTEAGEMADIVKRAFFYGKGRDSYTDNDVVGELGDIAWYFALACHSLGVSIESVMQANNAKLKARYPDKFKTENAYNRNVDIELDALAKGLM